MVILHVSRGRLKHAAQAWRRRRTISGGEIDIGRGCDELVRPTTTLTCVRGYKVHGRMPQRASLCVGDAAGHQGCR